MRRALIGGTAAVALACTIGGSSASASASGCDLSRPAVVYRPGGRAHVPARKRLVPCRYDTGARALEPSLDFTPDGRIVFQAWELQSEAPGGVPPVPRVVRADSSFSSWRDVSPPGPVASLDPFLTVDHRTGRIFSVNFLANGQPTCATISYSDNNGESWLSSPSACGGFDGESIAAGPPVASKPIGYADVVYYCTGTTPASSPPTTTPICSKSLDGGLTFEPATSSAPGLVTRASVRMGPSTSPSVSPGSPRSRSATTKASPGGASRSPKTDPAERHHRWPSTTPATCSTRG
jgi:hypothetical protein